MLIDYILLSLFGHVLGDFYFQSEKLSNEKNKNFYGVLIHSLEYLLAMFIAILPVISFDLLYVVMWLSILHFAIDSIKYYLINKKIIALNGKTFVFDQLIHMFSIIVSAYIFYIAKVKISHFNLIIEFFDAIEINIRVFLKIILSVLILCKPTNIFIQNILGGFKSNPIKRKNELLNIDNKAGRKIGTIERLIMLMFIAMNQYAAMGLVLTAKSIARYDRIAKDEEFAEYYLLGTLLSTAMVVICKVILLR